MSLRWEKLGCVFCPAGEADWMQSHASLPTALHLEGTRYRVYFASRDAASRSHVGWVELDFEAPGRPLRTAPAPVLAPGPLGQFDDHGVYCASTVRDGDVIYMYTIGWNPGARPPLFYAAIGLALSEDGGLTFRRLQPAPILARSRFDPCLVTAPCVLKEGPRWRMWYVSGLRWEACGDALQSFYHIKYAESDDGVHWDRQGHVCLDLEPGERNLSRPCVIRDGDRYRAWFGCNRGEGYRIGYAESPDGLTWTRLDEAAGIGLSPDGWDAEAMAYPHVVGPPGRRWMLYNGNGFGRTGFGLARQVPQA